MLSSLRVSVSSASEIDAASWSQALKPGGELSVVFPDEKLVAEAKLPLLLGGFALLGDASGGVKELTATKVAVGAKAELKKRDEFVDEDELLAADGLEAPEVSEGVGCSARKPFANCTCGRAEALAAPEQPTQQQTSSACGNCHKGDAFRCANCPHLGKPAFQEGKDHLVLDLQDDL